MKVSLSPELLHELLGLPDDVELEYVYTHAPQEFARYGPAAILCLRGESLPCELTEGREIPMVLVEITSSPTKHAWLFRKE